MSEAYIYFEAPINPVTTEMLLRNVIEQIQKDVATIYLLISSPGGHVSSAVTAFNALSSLPLHLITHNMGIVDSAANVIFLAGAKRYALPNSRFMFHGLAADLNGTFDRNALKHRLDSLESDELLMTGIIEKRTGIPKQDLDNYFRTSRFLSADIAQQKGLVHDVRDALIPAGAMIIPIISR
ncbi:MAG: ATP-dependent Clp protease proteolytic subunit [Thermaerobacter sp.]|nr:ATP-dependent Clp protease proteolytic subunit [Thermaerobacter sp.]